MKKIYILTAVFALLTLSLNAQVEKKVVEESPKVTATAPSQNQGEFKTLKGSNFTLYDALRGIKGMSCILPDLDSKESSVKGQMRAPQKLNSGEYLVGPYTTNDFSTNGLGFGNAYSSYQQIYLFTDLVRNDFASHDGDSIVGFRFALAGTSSDKAVLYDFHAWPYGNNGYFESANRHTWSIPELGGATPVTGFDDIVITVPGNSVVFSSIVVYDQNNNVVSSWNSNGTVHTVTSGSNTYTVYDLPDGWSLSNVYMFRWSNSGNYYGYLSSSSECSITIDGSVLDGCTSASVVINAMGDYGTESLDVNGDTRTVTTSIAPYTFNIASTTVMPVYMELEGGQWHEFYLDHPVEFTVADSIAGMYLGYRYFQYHSSETSEFLYPIAVNPNSTTHDHVSYRYGASSSSYSDIVITPSSNQVNFRSIAVVSGNTTITSWTTSNGNTLPSGWSCSGTWTYSSSYGGYTSGTITIPASLFSSYSNVKLNISAYGDNANQSITVAGDQKAITTSQASYSWDINSTSQYTSGWWTEDFSNYGDLAVQLIFKSSGPELTAPANGSTVDVGTSTGSGTSTTITVSGNNLTEDLAVSVSGTGFSVSTNSISAADANAGTTITIYYNGTTPNATGTLTIGSTEVSTTVNLTADYVIPELTAPTNGSTVDVGTNNGAGASTTINVSGNNLTENLTVSVNGTGFSVSPTTISAADANAGTTITVYYNGTTPNATGTLTISSGEVSTTVNLTADYVAPTPELTVPATVDVGTNNGSGTSTTVNVSGSYLTENLTVSVSGSGFSVSPTSISAADANAGTTVTVTYNGTNPNASGTLTFSSGEVTATVHLTASYVAELTICEGDGTVTNKYLPIYAYYYDDCQKNQMIYPESMVSSLAGKYITSMTFYANSNFNWSGGQVTARLGTTNQTNYTSKTRLNPSDMTIVASGFDVPAGGNTWTIVFDTPFEYNGGNLIVDMEETSHGTGTGTYSSNTFAFYGITHTGGGFYSNADAYIEDFSTVYSGGSVLDFLPKVTFTYEGGVNYSTDGIIRMGNLIIVDQFWASTAENKHPEQYSYLLRYTPAQGDPKESSPKTVDVEHTKSIVNGFYTEQDVKNDSVTYNTVIVNKMTADIELTLPNNDNQIYYVRIQGKDNAVPEEVSKVNDNTDMVAKMQLTSGDGGFYFIDQIPESHPQYIPGQVNHFKDNADPGTGTSSSSFKTYVPSIMTYGQDRRYFADDTLHNTYGAPIWRTGVGEVIIPDGMRVERQENQWGTTQWEDSQGNACSLFILDNIEAYGKLPNKRISNVDYEPYLFRIFVESSTDKLRGYQPEYVYSEEKPDSIIGTYLVRDDNFTNTRGPICIYSEYFDGAQHIDTISDPTNGDYFKFTLNKNTNNWVDNAMFGGLSNIIQGEDDDLTLDPLDLTVYVRFYYKSKGSLNPSHVIRAGGDTAPAMFYGAEGESPTPDPWTAVSEVRYHGEIVGVTYVNTQGMQSDKPFDGLNIVVTRYSDGSITTTKVIRR